MAATHPAAGLLVPPHTRANSAYFRMQAADYPWKQIILIKEKLKSLESSYDKKIGED